jgi:hypothetical protein
VKNWFQNLQLQQIPTWDRYRMTIEQLLREKIRQRSKVGLCTLNSFDP